jgi:uncharacterized protein
MGTMMSMETRVQSQEVEGVSGKGRTPCVHKFATERNHYVFDVNSGEILRVDPIVWEIIEDAHWGEEELITQYTSKFTPSQISTAYNEIARARAEQDLFVPYDPNVKMSLSRQAVHDKITSGRQMLTLAVTEKCNFQCTYCPFNLPDSGAVYQGTRDMSWETARAAIDDFLQHCSTPEPTVGASSLPTHSDSPKSSDDDDVTMSFYGGEPLLNFPLIKRCTEYALEKATRKIGFFMTTNGYFLKGETADFLADHDFTVCVSLDGPASIHDRHRRTRDDLPTHAVVLDNFRTWIRKYARSKRHYIISATVARDTDRRDVYEYFSRASWIPPDTSIMVNIAAPPYPGYHKSDPGEQTSPGRREAYEKYKEDVIRGRVGAGYEDMEMRLRRVKVEWPFARLHRNRWKVAHARRHSASCSVGGPCVSGARKTFVNVTGDYYPCERVPETEACRIGSVATGIDEEKVYRLLKEFVEATAESCERCWCLPICMLGCHGNVRGKDGYTLAARKQACEDIQKIMHERIVDYCSVLEQNPHAFDYLNSNGR